MGRADYWLSKWKWLIGIAILLALLNLATGQKPPFLEQQPVQERSK